jgi:hypothetical protein
MTKKHFIAMAKVIAQLAKEDKRRAQNSADDFMKLAKQINPRFDRVRFLTACGLA